MSHIIVFRSIGDYSTLKVLGAQFCPNKPTLLHSAMTLLCSATVTGEEPVTYIVVDMSAESQLPSNLRIYTNIFSSAKYFIVQNQL